MAHRLAYWENKENAIEESKKYKSRTEFCKGSFGAYTVSKKNGWLGEMTWLNRRNVYKDPVDSIYRYYFENENAIYVGRTIYLKLRDNQHRTRENDTVYRFAKEHNTEIPKIEVLEEGLTVLQGAERESYWEKYYRNKGFAIINKQPCGSLGYMCKGKWSKNKCFEEAKKYKTRSEFQKNSSQAYYISKKNGWIEEMVWLPKIEKVPKGYWNNKKNIIKEAKKYNSITDFQKNSGGAFNAARKFGILKDLQWLNKVKKLPFNFWKDKKHCIEESKKYNSRNEFRKNNQSAYWASLKYGYLEDMTWLSKRKTAPKGSLKNKELIMEEGRKYKTRGEFEKYNKQLYSAACRYGYIEEMYWMPKGRTLPKGYWDDFENVVSEAKKYKTKKELREKNSYLYKIMFKKGYAEKLSWLK